MNENYNDEVSSLGGVKANIIVLAIWVGPFVLNLIVPGFAYFGLILPIVFLLIEKKSELVRIHAGQALALYLVATVLLNVLTIIGGALFVGTLAVGSANAAVGAAGLLGIALIAVAVCELVFIVMACVKGWKFQAYSLPIIGGFGTKLASVFKLS